MLHRQVMAWKQPSPTTIICKLIKEDKLRALQISGRMTLVRCADIELMLKSKSYERQVEKKDFDLTELHTGRNSRDVRAWRVSPSVCRCIGTISHPGKNADRFLFQTPFRSVQNIGTGKQG